MKEKAKLVVGGYVAIIVRFNKYNRSTCRGKSATAYDATWPDNKATVKWLHDEGTNTIALMAAEKLINKMGWGGEWISGATGDGLVFVMKEPHPNCRQD